MSGEVFWLYEVGVRPGGGDALRDLMAELVDSARAEPGTLTYQWTISDDDTVAHVYERYADSTSTLAHLAVFRETFAERFLAVVERRRLVLYGQPEDAINQALSGLGPVLMSPLTGFDRHDDSAANV